LFLQLELLYGLAKPLHLNQRMVKLTATSGLA
jgi:hypothetical protein